MGCKNGGFYVLNSADGRILEDTPVYTGPPSYPLLPAPDRRMLALPSCIGGLQTGCATDGRTIFTNGIDALKLGSQEKPADSGVPPTGGRVVAISLDTHTELWRHERPRVATLGGRRPSRFTPMSATLSVRASPWPMASSTSRQLAAGSWSPSTLLRVRCSKKSTWDQSGRGRRSRGRVYVGTGNTLFSRDSNEGFFPKKYSGELYSFGVPGNDEIGRLGAGNE